MHVHTSTTVWKQATRMSLSPQQVHVPYMLLLHYIGNSQVHHWGGQNWINVHTKSHEKGSAGSKVAIDTKAHTARHFQKHTFFLVRKENGLRISLTDYKTVFHFANHARYSHTLTVCYKLKNEYVYCIQIFCINL